ncbi:MAG: ectoine/hydroxyectoine ABC transporter permease subunit EhuD [Acetobacteraceae bacterium]
MQQFFQLFDFSGAQNYMPEILLGAAITIELTICVSVLCLIIGMIIALLRLSRVRILRLAAGVYVEALRGTPLLLQLFYVYFVLPAVGLRIPAFAAGVIALTLNYSAYVSEVYRAGIKAVPKGQVEAAHALGLSRGRTMRLVVLPQAMRIVIPPLGNYFISLFKDTALASTITVHELMFSGQDIASTNFQYFAVYTIIGLIYLFMSYPGSLFVQYLERRMEVGYATPRAARAAEVSQPS